MKTVFKSSEIFHLFAHAHESKANPHFGRAGNLSFGDGAFIFYSTVLGRMIQGKNGHFACLLNGTNYSVRTSPWQWNLRLAVSHLQTFNLSRVSNSNGGLFNDFSRGCPLNFTGKMVIENLHGQAMDFIAQAHKPRLHEETRLGLLSYARLQIEDANRAILFFGSRKKPFDATSLCVLSPALLATKRKETAEAEAKRKADLAKRAANEAKRAELIAHYGPILQADWRKHLPYVRPDALDSSFYQRDLMEIFPATAEGFKPSAMLRVSVDGKRIETNLGAEVLARHAAGIIQLCRAAQSAGRAVPAELIAQIPPIDAFSVKSIDAFGNLVCGCHRISFAELQTLATALQLPVDGPRNALVTAFVASASV